MMSSSSSSGASGSSSLKPGDEKFYAMGAALAQQTLKFKELLSQPEREVQ